MSSPTRYTWTVACGTPDRDTLLFRLAAHRVDLNGFAAMLLAQESLYNGPATRVELIACTAGALGLTNGGTTAELTHAAAARGLRPCPADAAPQLRLHLDDLPMRGKLTVVAERVFSDARYPRGFYLEQDASRRWLRGYRASDDWAFEPQNWFVFGTS